MSVFLLILHFKLIYNFNQLLVVPFVVDEAKREKDAREKKQLIARRHSNCQF